jgi:hypothetical protein
MRMNMPKEEYRRLASMTDEEFEEAETRHAEGKMITGVILFSIVFLSMVVVLAGIV